MGLTTPSPVSSSTPPPLSQPQLHVGASLSQVKKSYRQMAIALHPDKCRLEGAAEAFQRVGTAYANLSKLLGG
jgi:curved DNA-binding protein CbpA